MHTDGSGYTGVSEKMSDYGELPITHAVRAVIGKLDDNPTHGDWEQQQEQVAKHVILAALEQAEYWVWAAERKCESPIEKMVFLQLFLLNFKSLLGSEEEVRFMNQVKIGPYRVDFLIQTEDAKIVVECDGHDFHEKTKEQAAKDKKRDRFLQSKGYRVLRFTGSEIWSKQVDVGKEVHDVLMQAYMEAHFPKEM